MCSQISRALVRGLTAHSATTNDFVKPQHVTRKHFAAKTEADRAVSHNISRYEMAHHTQHNKSRRPGELVSEKVSRPCSECHLEDAKVCRFAIVFFH